MIPNPIFKVLSTMGKHRVRALLMGGQACVFYGGAEFSIDSDFAIAADEENLALLHAALAELDAKTIAVPPFESEHLKRGHAIHFRCFHPDCEGLRVDVMARMRGVDDFEELWERRTTALDPETDIEFQLMALPDLVRAKKTQRSKDWPMILAVVDAHFLQFGDEPTPTRVEFWLREARTPTILRAVAAQFSEVEVEREAAVLARENADDAAIEAALRAEEERERALDRAYWAPLKAELEEFRRARRPGANAST